MTKEEINRDKVVKIFEESWKELGQEYAEKLRILSTFCSEADVELHLAHKLLNKLPAESVHIEFPIPLEIERLSRELFAYGRVKMTEYVKPDIVVIDPLVADLYLIAELKYTPIYWSYLPLYLAREKKLSKEDVEQVKKGLERSINYLQKIRQEEPTPQSIEKIYLTNVSKMIGILNDLEKEENETVAGYLCVIDEIYPNIEEILKRTIKKFNPPNQFRILAEHFTVYENLEKTLEQL